MRQFIRHPAAIPIEVRRNGHDHQNYFAGRTRDVCLGGLAAETEHQLAPGTIVDVRIPFVRPPFVSKARVAWCNACDKGYKLGVEFLDADEAFRARMIEQVRYIEQYQEDCRKEGRYLTADEAAAEWIERYAAQFPVGSIA